MSWETVFTPSGAHLVNWVAIQQIVRNYLRTTAMVRFSTIVGDIKWFGPNLYSVDTDWPKIREYVDKTTPSVLTQIKMNMKQSGDSTDTRAALAGYRAAAAKAELEFEGMVRQAQKMTSAAIESAVGTGEVALEVAKFVRDMSAEVLMIGATVATGGTAGVVFVFVAGPALKATAKYQDTGNAAAAGMEFGIALTSNFVGKGIDKVAAGSIAKNVGYNFVATSISNTAGDAAKAWVEGNQIGGALAGGAAKSGAAVVTEPGKTAISELAKTGRLGTKGVAVGSLALSAITTIADRAAAAAFSTSAGNGKLPLPDQVILLDAVNWDEQFVDNFCWVPISSPMIRYTPPESPRMTSSFRVPYAPANW